MHITIDHQRNRAKSPPSSGRPAMCLTSRKGKNRRTRICKKHLMLNRIYWIKDSLMTQKREKLRTDTWEPVRISHWVESAESSTYSPIRDLHPPNATGKTSSHRAKSLSRESKEMFQTPRIYPKIYLKTIWYLMHLARSRSWTWMWRYLGVCLRMCNWTRDFQKFKKVLIKKLDLNLTKKVQLRKDMADQCLVRILSLAFLNPLKTQCKKRWSPCPK